jgi:hypothetical protein
VCARAACLWTHAQCCDAGNVGAAEINKAYAERHGYRLELVRGDGHAADRDARWSKVMILRNLLDAEAGDGDDTFVLWMDSDAVFTNFDFPALSVAQRMITEGAHVAVCKDLSVPRYKCTE